MKDVILAGDSAPRLYPVTTGISQAFVIGDDFVGDGPVCDASVCLALCNNIDAEDIKMLVQFYNTSSYGNYLARLLDQ